MSARSINIRAVIEGREISRDQVRAWEAARLAKAARKLGLPIPKGSLEEQRQRFADAKLSLGRDAIVRRLERDLRLSDMIARTAMRLAGSRRALSICELHSTGGSAAAFVRWFSNTSRHDYARSMIAANPDHFLIDVAADGAQQVIETTGGSPFAARFFVDYTDTASLVTARAASFPFDVSGVARGGSQRIIGGVRHEFRDEPAGFHARLVVEFPALMAPSMLRQHRWHLACEFSNWIEFAFAS